jgi:hypothetical protein
MTHITETVCATISDLASDLAHDLNIEPELIREAFEYGRARKRRVMLMDVTTRAEGPEEVEE